MFSPDGTPLATPDSIDAVTQLKLMVVAVPAGNSERVMPAMGETLPLHSYWDKIFGGFLRLRRDF